MLLPMTKPARAAPKPVRAVIVGETCVSEQGLPVNQAPCGGILQSAGMIAAPENSLLLSRTSLRHFRRKRCAADRVGYVLQIFS